MMADYSRAWAEAQDRLPCKVGSGGGDAICDLSVTFEQYAADPRNHYSVTGRRFTNDDLRALWRCVLRQRMEMQALWLVAQGRFVAINPALDYLRRELGEPAAGLATAT